MAAAANSIISDPTLPTLPTAWSLIDYAIGYKEIQQLSNMEGYSQSFGQARVGWTTSRHHNIATWWNEYECDAAIIVSPWLHCRKILSITTFLFKNWRQRFDIDEEMYQRSVDDGSSQYFMARIIWILWYSPHISSTSSDVKYIKSYISTQQPTWLDRYWRSYGSSNFGSETHHRSITFCRAINSSISNLWWYFLHINTDNDVFYWVHNRWFQRRWGGQSG